jgi:hypothetical protein
MKIPLDFFLRLIEKFLNEQEFDKVIKKLKKHFEMPEEDFSDILSDLSLQDIISKYVKENKELKKKLKEKSKKFLEINKDDDEEEKEKLTSKKRKRTMSNEKEEKADDEKPTKKRKRSISSTKDEKQIVENEEKNEKSKRKKSMSNTKEEKEKSAKKRKKTEDKIENEEDEKEIKKEKKKKKKKEDDDEDIDLEKEVKFIPKPKSNSNPDRVPFKRIDDSNIKHQVPENLRDNSYAAFMKQTGDDFGKAANDKLIVTRGKGFRKEKTKFKNKTFHGGMTISTTVRSIPLEDDSSSD